MKYIIAFIVMLCGSLTGMAADTGNWAGSYDIYSDGYRMCPPPISVKLTLKKTGTNTYKGIWSMKIADDDGNDSGMLFGDVTGSVVNGVLTIKTASMSRAAGKYDNFFAQNTASYPLIKNGEIIAKISKKGAAYKIQPVGKMSKYLTSLGGRLTIKKRK